MRQWLLPIPLVVLLASGCAGPAEPVLQLQPGDVVRPEVSFAPRDPWPTGARVSLGVLLRVERPGGVSHYLMDDDVPLEQADMTARVTFLDGDRVLGDPLEVPLVHDC